jgi:lipoprotein-releasing system permease protein
MLPIQIAYRFLRSSLGQTILIVVGISVGVSVQVFIGSLIAGLQQDLVNTTIGNSSQITIESLDDSQYISEYKDIKNNLAGIEGIDTISYSFDQAGTVIFDTETEPVLLRGVDFNLAEGIYGIKEKIVEGVLPVNDNEIMLGTNLMEELDLNVNDIVELSIPLKGSTTMKIVGVYDFRVSSINDLWVITTLSTVQSIVGDGLVISSIEMQVEDVFAAEEISETIKTIINDDSIIVGNWIENNEDLLTGLQAQSSSSLLIQVFVTISVVLGITSVLAITVIQKSKQIGILKAMGIKDKEASLIFLTEGFFLGVLGAIGGVLLGLVLAWMFSTFAVDSSGEPVVTLLINGRLLLISGIVAIVSASLASVIPARRSSRLSVIEVIRNG